MKETAAPQKRWRLAAIPAVIFVALALVFWKGLGGNPSEIPSALIGKPVAAFSLPPLDGMDVPGFDAAALRQGRVTVVNVWASWCGPCRTEHPLLMELAKRPDIRLFGINYKDDGDNARKFLGSLGQPFAAIGVDESGRTAVDWGVYGVPETFIVDGAGVIRFKWIGPLTAEALSGKLAEEIARASAPLTAP
jgi:cytochrome c biogenesis protein CcmG/thiol:disulfide interchange protein DsbE